MALPDIDIYNWLLVDILKVQPTGDPVNDSIYLVLLPMVVLYMYVDKVVGSSRFATKKIEVIIMFIMGFFIIREGYYPMFAAFSMPLLIIVMLWHTLSFVFGRKNKGAGGGSGTSGHPTRQEIGSGGNYSSNVHNIKSMMNLPDTINRELAQINDEINRDTQGDREAATARIRVLDTKYAECDKEIDVAQKVKSSTGSAGHVGELMDKIQARQANIANEAIELMVDNKLTSNEMRKLAPNIYPNRRREIDRIRY